MSTITSRGLWVVAGALALLFAQACIGSEPKLSGGTTGGIGSGGSGASSSSASSSHGGATSSGTAGGSSSSGTPVQAGAPGNDLTAGGQIMKSTSYKMIGALGESPGGNGVAASTNHHVRSGVLGTTQ
jgi:hypothetical protein